MYKRATAAEKEHYLCSMEEKSKNIVKGKIERTIDEINKHINLPHYQSVVARVINRVFEEGCSVSTVDNILIKRSSYERSPDGCRIRLNVRVKQPVYILWALLHEFGHHLDKNQRSPKPPGSPITIEDQKTEIMAWKNADKEFKSNPESIDDYQSFIDFQKDCLKTYGVDFDGNDYRIVH
jgi:hypothetical protein